MRSLVHVPIIHSDVDLGSYGPQLQADVVKRFGAGAWAAHTSSVDTMWADIRSRILALPLDWRKVRLFQDGLPTFGREREIVDELASKGSRNHQLLLQCIERGATLMGTEDPQLLLQEYARVGQLIAAAASSHSGPSAEALRSQGQALLAARDAFMANRIDATVGAGETAVLLVGLMHHVDRLLDGKFRVLHLVASLPLSAEPERQIQEGKKT